VARPVKFSSDQILDAARAAVTRHGRAATIAHVAAQIDVPVGSIYHRFGSREELFVALWLRSIRRFHVGLLTAAQGEDPHRALLECAVHIPRYCRAHPAEAVALTLYRQADLLADGPAALAEQIRTVNDEVFAAISDLTRRRYGRADADRLEVVTLAVQQCAYGLVRPYLGRDVPALLDDAVEVAADALLRLGERPPSSRGSS